MRALVSLCFVVLSLPGGAVRAEDGPGPFLDAATRKWGIRDGAGKVVVKPEFDRVLPCVEPGFVIVAKGLLYDDYAPEELDEGGLTFGKVGLFTTSGARVLPVAFDAIGCLGEGRFAVNKEVSKKASRLAIFDERGKAITRFEYVKIEPFDGGLAEVCSLARNGLDFECGLAGRDGKLVVPREYAGIGSFSAGVAAASRDGRHGVIDRAGKVVVPFEYGYVSEVVDPEAIVASKDGKLGVINVRNEVVVPFEWALLGDLSEGRRAAKRENNAASKWGYLDAAGREVIPFEFDKAEPFANGRAKVVRGGKALEIDPSGNALVP